MHFMEAFLALCLIRGSEPLDGDRAGAGRPQPPADGAPRAASPGLRLQRDGRALVTLAAWGAELLDELAGICELLDAGDPARPYASTLTRQAGSCAILGAHALARATCRSWRGADGNLRHSTRRCRRSTATGLAADAGRDAVLQRSSRPRRKRRWSNRPRSSAPSAAVSRSTWSPHHDGPAATGGTR